VAYGTAASDPDVTVKGLGRPFVVADPGLALKKFPCCYACHRGMDGLLALRATPVRRGSVEKVICRMPPGGMLVLTYPRPVTGLEGKFSMEYCIAAGVLDGKYGLATFHRRRGAPARNRGALLPRHGVEDPPAGATIRTSRRKARAAAASSR
jgi:2-methylcitrate dehydratase PrpD